MNTSKLMNVTAIASLTVVCACSPVMEATRPDPVDISQFRPGQSKISVMSQVGGPLTTTPDGLNSCDIYRMFTRGPGSAGKGAIAVGEVVADVFTLGLTEIIFTPVEAATRNSKHTVLFCYNPGSMLVSVAESDMPVDH